MTVKSIIDTGGAILTGKQGQNDSIHLGYDGEPVWLTVKLRRPARPERAMDTPRSWAAARKMGHLKSIQVYEMMLTRTVDDRRDQAATRQASSWFNLAGEEKVILLNITPTAGKPAILPLKIFSGAVPYRGSEKR